MAFSKKKIMDHKNELLSYRPHVTTEDLVVGKEYHIPPVLSIERMDIVVTGKTAEKIRFRVSGEKEEQEMHSRCVLSRFIIERRCF